MNFKNLKYGFLISMTTMFGGSSLQMYAQNDADGKAKIENSKTYRQQFLESIAPDKRDISVEFVVDSVAEKNSNGDLVADVNVIQLLAYLDQDSDEYQSYMASRHIVAHEMWHRICMMNEVLEKPMSATHYRTGRDNFEITASIVQLLTFREDYINASPKQRLELRKLEDPKIRMYIMAVEHDLIRPLSNDKKDFDFEMEFIAKTVSGYWNNNMAQTYAPLHNAMTKKSGRKEFNSPVYEKNFIRDIKRMNTIGGIDFSKLYNFRDIRNRVNFPTETSENTTVIKQSLSAPNYETWVNKRSSLKRFSRQKIDIPNFTGNRLAEERRQRPNDERIQPYRMSDIAGGYKTYPFMKVPFYAAAQLKSAKRTIKLYPHGVMDIIGPQDEAGLAVIKTLNYDGSYETGKLKNGRKDGVFVFYDRQKKEIGHCTYLRGRATDGEMVLATGDEYVRYIYKAGELVKMDCIRKDGTKKTICTFEGGKPVSGLIPTSDVKTSSLGRSYLLYSDKKLSAGLIFETPHILSEKQEIITIQSEHNVSPQFGDTAQKNLSGKTIQIERFYADGKIKYKAERNSIVPLLHDKKVAIDTNTHNDIHSSQCGTVANERSATDVSSAKPCGQICREALFSPEGHPIMAAEYTGSKKSFKIKIREFLSVLKRIGLSGKEKESFVSILFSSRNLKTADKNLRIADSTTLPITGNSARGGADSYAVNATAGKNLRIADSATLPITGNSAWGSSDSYAADATAGQNLRIADDASLPMMGNSARGGADSYAVNATAGQNLRIADSFTLPITGNSARGGADSYAADATAGKNLRIADDATMPMTKSTIIPDEALKNPTYATGKSRKSSSFRKISASKNRSRSMLTPQRENV